MILAKLRYHFGLDAMTLTPKQVNGYLARLKLIQASERGQVDTRAIVEARSSDA